jgi:hypothetical protein
MKSQATQFKAKIVLYIVPRFCTERKDNKGAAYELISDL